MEQRTSAEDVSAAVRVHADRVHDFARRLGCAPGAASEVVETSALDLVRACEQGPASVSDLVGWWFGRARALSTRVAGRDPGVPLGSGLLASDAEQARVAAALESLPEVERVGLLVRDSYALPVASLAVAVASPVDTAMELVGRARLRFLQGIGDALPRTAGHTVDLAGLARLGEGGPVAARDATTRRHAQSCEICKAVLACQQRAHLLLTGLTVVALPEADRTAVLARTDAAARSALPTGAALAAAQEERYDDELDDGRSPWAIPLYALLGLFVAVGVGVLVGVMLIRSPSGPRSTGSDVALDPGVLPSVTAPGLPSTAPPPPPPSPSPQPITSVFTVMPSPSEQPGGGTASPSPTPAPEPASDPLTLTSTPTSGPNGQDVNVSGTGWTPDGLVTLEYFDPLNRPTGSRTTQAIDARGRFTTTIAAQDPSNLPGRHTIRVSDGTNSASVAYTAS